MGFRLKQYSENLTCNKFEVDFRFETKSFIPWQCVNEIALCYVVVTETNELVLGVIFHDISKSHFGQFPESGSWYNKN